MGVWYTTREDVKSALDIKLTARSDAQVDRAIEAASRAVEGLLKRRFYPWSGTRYKDWPNSQHARSYRLWLDADEVISVSSLVSGGTTISASDYFLRRGDDIDEPPYTFIEIDLDSSASFDSGNTHQRSVAITGVFGYSADEESAGALAEALDSSETGVDVTDSAVIGVGDIIKADSERMIVTGKSMLDTGVDIHASDSLTATQSDVSITLSTTTGAPTVGETILIDSERMLVVDVAGSTITVKRAWDGSTLATHAAGTSIYAPRTLTVSRAALGTTAATHSTSLALTKHVVPGLVAELALAYALNNLLQAQSGYARIAGEGESAREYTGRGIRALEKDAMQAYRRIRIGAV